MEHLEVSMVAAAGLVLVAVVASRLAARSGIPVVVLFLAIGMLAGSDGPGNIAFDNYDVARAVGVVALAYILFSGGLGTPWRASRAQLRSAILLATAGVLITAGIVGATAIWLLHLPAKEGLLLGAIVSSTDAAAIFAVLRRRERAVPARIRHLLELESGFNDPMAVVLTLGLLELITNTHASIAWLVASFFIEMSVGTLAGLAAGVAMVWIVNRIDLDFEGLYPVLTLALVALVYAATHLAHGSGFLAVYIAGACFGNSRVAHRDTLVRFHDAVAWLMQITMFLVLGLLVFPHNLDNVAGRAIVVAVVLVFVARPVATLVTLTGSGIVGPERLLVAWCGLRGAVPVVLATFPEAEHLARAQVLFDVVFFVVLVSVVLQGSTIHAVARLLRVRSGD